METGANDEVTNRLQHGIILALKNDGGKTAEKSKIKFKSNYVLENASLLCNKKIAAT